MNHHRPSEDSGFALVPRDANFRVYQPYNRHRAPSTCCQFSQTCNTLISSEQPQQSISEPRHFFESNAFLPAGRVYENLCCPHVKAQGSICNAHVWVNNCSHFINTHVEKWWLRSDLDFYSRSPENNLKSTSTSIRPVFFFHGFLENDAKSRASAQLHR